GYLVFISGFEPVLRAARVRLQAFAVRQRRGDAPQGLGTLVRYVDEAAAFLEVVYAQRRRKARRARGGQHVIGAGAVVAQRLGTVAAHEDGARMADLVGPDFGLPGGDLE